MGALRAGSTQAGPKVHAAALGRDSVRRSRSSRRMRTAWPGTADLHHGQMALGDVAPDGWAASPEYQCRLWDGQEVGVVAHLSPHSLF